MPASVHGCDKRRLGIFSMILACTSQVEEVDLVSKKVSVEASSEKNEMQTEILTAKAKDVPIVVRLKEKNGKVFFDTFFDEGVFRYEFIEKYRNKKFR